MYIRTITKVNIGYIPGHNCGKDRKLTIPFADGEFFCPGGLGGVAHEQVAPMVKTMRRK